MQQDVFLFDGSVRDNIAYGRHDATDAEVEDAARRANAHEFIVKLPEGYETFIGERGVKLSGGQQQRLAIARAILASPQILILDEATSNLDTESEQLIQASMATLLRRANDVRDRPSTVDGPPRRPDPADGGRPRHRARHARGAHGRPRRLLRHGAAADGVPRPNRRCGVAVTATPFPDWVEPMAATLTQERFTGPEWIFERKFDGIRLLAFKQGTDVRLFSRNRLPQNIPSVAEAIARLPVAGRDPRRRSHLGAGAVAYHVFDILWLEGRDVTSLPLDARRALVGRAAASARRFHRVAPLDDPEPWGVRARRAGRA